MNIAIILAGGTGKRMNNKFTVPKQFIKIKDREIIIHTIQKFEDCYNIHKILVVMNTDWIDFTKRLIDKYSFHKIIDIISGGETRQESSYNSLAYLREIYYKDLQSDTDDVILIHDAVRPFVNQRIINEAIKKTKEHNAICTVVKTIDTIVESENGFVKSIPERKTLYSEQTPQGFKFSLIWSAYEKGKEKYIHNSTDDISFVHNVGKPVYLIEGDYNNFKITTANDVLLAKYLMDKGNVIT
jgi:2-C-methyl-D-erythritol 4-phosphate cytidylyltransferase